MGPIFGGESGIKTNKLQMYGTFEGIFLLIGAFFGLVFVFFFGDLYTGRVRIFGGFSS